MIPFIQGKDLAFKEPIVNTRASKKVTKELSNAWKDGTVIDEKGWMWVKKDKLHSILRTNKLNVNFIVMHLDKDFKRTYNQEVYVRGFKVIEYLARSVEENGVGGKGINLETSKLYYDSVNNCDSVKKIRLEYDLFLKEARKRLKQKRKKKYRITHDELTGQPLLRGSEFSHIRSVAMYKDISDHVENGLLVNKETHILITERGINNEEELLDLCIELGWKTHWYEPYTNQYPI